MCNNTILYYNKNVEAFSKNTLSVNFHEIQDKFLSYLSQNAFILDFGCGSGRDIKYFLSKSFQVEAIDGSFELCKIAEKETGIQVKNKLFQELNEENKYDAIWACASILHLPYEEIPTVINKIHRALKEDGIFYMSFKYGFFEGERNGRYFTYMTEDQMNKLLKQVLPFELMEQFITRDVRPERKNEQWLNVILRCKKGN